MKRILYSFLVVITFGFFACSNEIDLTAEHKDITVVYGLLDPKADTNWVRINKAFLGDGNALVFAQISDSLYYDSVFAYLLAYNTTNNTLMDSIVLERVDDPFPKDSGIFANDKNILYRTTETLNSAYRYKLTIIKPMQDDTLTTSTVLCKNFFMVYPPNASTILTWEDPFNLNPNPRVQVKWAHDANSYAYQLGFTFHYTEWTVGNPGNVSNKQFTYYMPMFSAYNPSGGFNTQYFNGSQVFYDIFKSDFYGAIKLNIQADPPGTPGDQLHVRKFASLDILILQAQEELYKYITLNQPSLSMVQKLSDYTNVSGGMGIFSSRSKSGLNSLNLSQQTRDSLRLGQFTGDLNFVP